MKKPSTPTKKGDLVPARLRARMEPGEMLRTLRELQGLSQAALASACGVPQPAISALENGSVALGSERAQRLAEVLGVHPGVLLWPSWEPAADETRAAAGSR